MSGHSHYSTIKHKKEKEDQRRGKIFSKLSRKIAVAAREKGGTPDKNSSLRLAIDRAKKFNMPKDNIERAIKRGTGELEGKNLEELLYEAYGPGGVAIIIEGITDNKNRTISDVKQILSKYQGKLAKQGSVRWLFERKGCITVNLEDQTPETEREDLELKAIDSGAEDIYAHNSILDIYTDPQSLEKIKQDLEQQKVEIESATLDWVAKEKKEISPQQEKTLQKLFEELDQNEAVQEIYSNVKD